MFHISRQPYPRSDPSDPDSRSQGPAASRESSGPTCPYCSGSGVDPHTDETCAACDGSGWDGDPLELGPGKTVTPLSDRTPSRTKPGRQQRVRPALSLQTTSYSKGDVMDMQQFMGGQFMQAADVPQPAYLTIAAVETTQLPDGGTVKTKAVLLFTDNRRAVLNKTNTASLAAAFGRDSSQWIGRTVLIRAESAMFQGKLVPALRLYPAQVQQQAAPVPPVPPPAPVMPQPAAVFQQPAAQQPLPLTPATPPAPAAFPAPPQLPNVPH